MTTTTSQTTSIPKVQRALVFQGGGALGAYQAGVFKSLYEKIKRNQKLMMKNDVPLFDIIAGTSIGAINGAILVSYFLENKTWDGASERLESFWKHLSTPTPNISEALKLWKTEYEKGNPFSRLRRISKKILFSKRIFKIGCRKRIQAYTILQNKIINFVILKINGLYMITNH